MHEAMTTSIAQIACVRGRGASQSMEFVRLGKALMQLHRFTIDVSTEGNNDIVNLNPQLTDGIKKIRGDGLIHVFVGGSTAAVTTLEFEPGLVKHDMPALFQKLVPD